MSVLRRPLEPLIEAQRRILDASRVLDGEDVEPDEAIGRVIPASVVSPIDLPKFVNSQMDGYAVRSEDCSVAGVTLSSLGTVMAGTQPHVAIGPGQTIRIMTGAPLPIGADAVCPVEDVEVVGDAVIIGVTVASGSFVRSPGDDLRAGVEIIPGGSILDPVGAGLLRAVGIDRIHALRRPRVGILSTGDELVVDAGASLGEAAIFDANRTVLRGVLSDAGCEVVDLGVVGDDEEALLTRLMQSAPNCDAIVSTGGVSVGDRDIVRTVLDRLPSSTAIATAVAIKPGKPHVFAVFGDTGTLLFGLPGNPVSAVVTFELFVRPALMTMAGRTEVDRPRLTAIAGDRFARQPDGKLHLRPVRFDAGWPLVARTDGRTGSHMLSSVRDIDGLALVPDGDGIEAGSPVECMVLRTDRAVTMLQAASAERSHP